MVSRHGVGSVVGWVSTGVLVGRRFFVTDIDLASVGVGSPVVEDVVDRRGVAAFEEGFFRDEVLRSTTSSSKNAGMGFSRFRLDRDHADLLKPCGLKERMNLAHLTHGLDPQERAEFAGPTDKRGGQTGTTISGMNHYALQRDQLLIQSQHRGPVPPTSMSKELVAWPQRSRRCHKETDADRTGSVPQHGGELHESDVVAAVMPPSEIRPVAFGGGTDPQIVPKTDG